MANYKENTVRLSNAICVSAFLILSLAAVAKPKQYEVIINRPVQAGSVQLKTGKYQLELEGNTATLYQRDKEVGKIQVRAEEESQKLDVTRVGTVDDKITTIELGGTKTKLTVQ